MLLEAAWLTQTNASESEITMQTDFCEYFSALLIETEMQPFDPPLIACTHSTNTLSVVGGNDLRGVFLLFFLRIKDLVESEYNL